VKLLPLILFGLYGIFYFFSNRETVPLTGRKQLVDISREQESSLGLQSYRQILRQERVISTGQNAQTVKDIGRRLSAVSEDPGFEWDYNLIDSPQVNAFCLPGGKVAVYTGILPVAKNANGLAVVMGHEIAHAIARHGAERMAHQKLVQIGTLAAGVAVSDMEPGQQRAVMGALGVGAQFGVLLPFSREHESEADYMGLIYVARACFDPTEAPKLWERMGQASGGRGPAQFTSTHPSHETRIRQFQEWMPEALKIRREKCGG
jgi:predicted Zn-dependent protease